MAPKRTAPTRIAISIGDPAGIGPEVTARAVWPRPPRDVQPVLVGDRRVIRRAFRELPSRPRLVRFTEGHNSTNPGCIAIDDSVTLRSVPRLGRPTKEGARASVAWFDRAMDLVIEGRADGLVTAPVNKGEIVAAGIPFIGHTERLAERTRTAHPVMMLATDKLRVALATTHLPLRDVVRRLSAAGMTRSLVVTATALEQQFGIESPVIALAALNPHAGDAGAIGTEEHTLLTPAAQAARAQGVNVVGPLPADTLFARAVQGEFAAVLALYHDQGLIPIKLTGFGQGINITLGVPIVRTSPDHGTAYELAGKAEADPRSMREAVRLASVLARGARNAQASKART